ncbi:MAG: ATP synthase F1 subunit epsilon [Phycisphaerae bacterium]|nr:ATP synthase F1 subunit epsilon [Phycisphaerae bacterium]
MPITVQILTPDGLVFEALDATFVAASGEGGDLGIETNHSNLLTTLRIGPLRIRTAGGEHPFAVHGGFLEATPEAVRIVADAAEPADAIDTERARTARRRAEERLKRKAADTDIARAEAALARALLRLQLAGKAS